MTEDKITPLRERVLEDMRIRGMGDKAQKSHIRAIRDFAKFLKRSPDSATPAIAGRATPNRLLALTDLLESSR